ncbi:uncharacterized protein N0V89_003597 [Didymosphaeria variabile]|uniref:Heterokaryon incompatibility domain-containing protein n=1 Tax=Didymosphaeria variabile TaxID=1932322 RepID=A0A9W8XP16_9PLEO|nr:uncharacterized protein N0V89_003597 [Didymosphaeria variabile]KAJ4355577.1 hypothetical protein N0V89_003597 [Didymosphaeria variabile]
MDNPVEHVASDTAGSVTSGSRLLKWYQGCLNHHEDCRPIFDSSYRPSRLLDLRQAPSEPVKLVAFDGEDLESSSPAYATLSHCWGSSQPLRLLTTNIEQLKEGIPRDTIPRVFSEAIDVCWHLGLRYLWIDSLCILQDSVEDWVRESQLMGMIYSRAMINIGATGSTNCNGSLFNTAQEAPSVGLVAWEGVDDIKYVVVENDIEWSKSFMDQPLLRRAWVMQERLLATRMIHFAQSQLVWECRTTAATEAYPVRVPEALWPFHNRRNRFWGAEFTEDDGAWSVLVGEYSKCELTFSKDKLVALSGLVTALEATGLTRGRYWAGMWEADLPYCLLWTRGAIDPSQQEASRPSAYRAPSWSWASLNHPIWTAWASGSAESPLVSHWGVKEEKGPSSSASLLLHYPVSIHLKGPLVQVEIQVKGPRVEAIGRGIERVQGVSYSIARIVKKRSTIDFRDDFWDDAWNDVVFDDFDETNLIKKTWGAPIYECEEWIEDADDDMRLLGLLLEEVEHGTFRRIGAFSIGHLPDRQALKRLAARTYTII